VDADAVRRRRVLVVAEQPATRERWVQVLAGAEMEPLAASVDRLTRTLERSQRAAQPLAAVQG
jgi:hypothetical protein